MNMMFADGHAEWEKKMAGNWNDLISSDPDLLAPIPTFSTNAVIDQIMAPRRIPGITSIDRNGSIDVEGAVAPLSRGSQSDGGAGRMN